MRRLLISILALLCAFPTLALSKMAHAEPSRTLYTCIFPTGDYAGQEIIVRYDARAAELSLVSNNTGATVQILETGLNTPQFEVRGWSSDCRYMIASLGVWGEQQTAAWDVVENRRVGTIETKGQRHTDLIWSPTNDYRLLIESFSGAWLWHLPSNSQVQLNPQSSPYADNFQANSNYTTGRPWWRRIVWDLDHNQVLAVPIDAGRTGVAVYDIYTGQEVAFYALMLTNDPIRFRLFDNDRYLVVYSISANSTSSTPQLAIFDRTDGSALTLSGHILAGPVPLATFSDSGRYLMVRVWDIFVWDLQNLDANTPHLPNYTLPLYLAYGTATNTIGVRMDTNETIVQAVKYWYGTDFTIYQWNLATEERFYAKKYLETVCDDLSQLTPEDDVELVTWACSYR